MCNYSFLGLQLLLLVLYIILMALFNKMPLESEHVLFWYLFGVATVSSVLLICGILTTRVFLRKPFALLAISFLGIASCLALFWVCNNLMRDVLQYSTIFKITGIAIISSCIVYGLLIYMHHCILKILFQFYDSWRRILVCVVLFAVPFVITLLLVGFFPFDQNDIGSITFFNVIMGLKTDVTHFIRLSVSVGYTYVVVVAASLPLKEDYRSEFLLEIHFLIKYFSDPVPESIPPLNQV